MRRLCTVGLLASAWDCLWGVFFGMSDSEREEMMMKKKASKWMTLSALFMFAAATFQIASSNFILGVVFFGAAASFTCAANVYREKEKKQKQEGDDKQ